MVGVLLAVLVLPACGGDGFKPECGAIQPVASASLARVPGELELTKLGTVTGVRVDAPQVTATLQLDATVGDATTKVQRHFTGLGWQVANTDNEGFEAEIFVVRDADTGLVNIREADCDGRVTLDVTIVPATPAPSASPSASPSR